MRWLLDPEDRRLGQPSRGRKAKGNKRPIAQDDTVVVLPDSDPRLIDVKSNDIDPEGGDLTLISAFAAIGTASVTSDGRVSYVPSPGYLGGDTVVYEIADPEDQRDTGQINISVADAVLQIIETDEERLEVETDGAMVDVTISEPADLSGTYAVDPFHLMSGPANMKAPEIAGDIEDGLTVTAVPGLWAKDASSGAVVRALQWRVGGIDQQGETADSFQIASGQTALGISLRETLVDSLGSRSVLSVSGASTYVPGQDSELIGWWDASDLSKVTDSGGSVSALAASGGSSDMVSPNVGKRPVTGTDTINGLNALSFTADYAEADVMLPSSGDFAVHLVCDIGTVTNAYSGLICFDATADFQVSAGSSNAFTGEMAMDQIGDSFPMTGGPFAGPLVLSVIFDLSGNGTVTMLVNNVFAGSGPISVPASSTGQIRLFTNRPRSVFVDGLFGELIVTEAIDATASILSYLSSKWGIS